MAVYGTLARVIANLEADSPEAALEKLRRVLDRAGFTVYDGDNAATDVYEAEEGTKPDDLPQPVRIRDDLDRL